MTKPGAGRGLRISFRQFDGAMLGTCWCGRTQSSPHPRPLWEWLDDHDHATVNDEAGPTEQAGADG